MAELELSLARGLLDAAWLAAGVAAVVALGLWRGRRKRAAALRRRREGDPAATAARSSSRLAASEARWLGVGLVAAAIVVTVSLGARVVWPGALPDVAGGVARGLASTATWWSGDGSESASRPGPTTLAPVRWDDPIWQAPKEPAEPGATPMSRWVLLAWLGVTGLLLTRHVASGVAAVLEMRGRRGEVDDPTLRAAIAQRAEAIGLRRTPALRWSGSISAPAVVGWFRPVVLLPASLRGALRPDQLLAVLDHELWHVRRGDVWREAGQRLLESVLWFQPAVGWMSDRLRRSRERLCDAGAVASGRDPWQLADALLRVSELTQARRARPGLLGVGLSVSMGHGPADSLRERLEALVGPEAVPPRRTGERGSPGRGAMSAVVAVGAFVLSGQLEPGGDRASWAATESAAPAVAEDPTASAMRHGGAWVAEIECWPGPTATPRRVAHVLLASAPRARFTFNASETGGLPIDGVVSTSGSQVVLRYTVRPEGEAPGSVVMAPGEALGSGRVIVDVGRWADVDQWTPGVPAAWTGEPIAPPRMRVRVTRVPGDDLARAMGRQPALRARLARALAGLDADGDGEVTPAELAGDQAAARADHGALLSSWDVTGDRRISGLDLSLLASRAIAYQVWTRSQDDRTSPPGAERGAGSGSQAPADASAPVGAE